MQLTAVGIRGKDGIVFGVEKLVTSKLYEAGANKRIFNIDRHIGLAVAGLLADSRQIVEVAREEASNYRFNYGTAIPLKHLTDRVSGYIHAHTLYSSVRPFGVSCILGSYDDEGPVMYMIDPSGVSWMRDMPITDLVKEVAKIIYIVHDEVKDKNFELELSWVGETEKFAKEALEESDDSDEEEL
ncbi:hypothetical protein KUTeg_014464 [Tegillarca granosa]|uniref:Proteasome subunit alpha type-3 n=1 Tax=Tegillarca granosa TaxID=220873 RepID=A0ABQ9EWL7_TEGGR|nr:hypothetical protein KUTeg_014464 [Tegillarca granosa]